MDEYYVDLFYEYEGGKGMGIFDFLKKKKSTESITIMDQPLSKTVKAGDKEVNEKLDVMISLEISVDHDGPPPLRDLLKDATPSKQGLYPHEIVMLEYAPTYKTTKNNFQQFWYYQYSVTDPQSVLDSLFEKEFIKEGDLRSAIEKLKMPEIKEELKLIGQKITGKKADLIDRLMENVDLKVLDAKYSERYYVLTAKGEQELNENQYVSYLHKKRYMTVWEMNKRIANTHYPYRDILWAYFNEQAVLHFHDFDFGLYRNIRLDMYHFLMEENKPKAAFKMLCEVLSFDLSGLSNGDKILFESEKTDPKFYLTIYEGRFKHFFPYEKTSLLIPPGIAAIFVEMQNIFEFSDEEYREAILRELSEVHPPRRIFTDKEIANIIIAYMHDDTATLSMIYKNAEERERERLKEIKSKAK